MLWYFLDFSGKTSHAHSVWSNFPVYVFPVPDLASVSMVVTTRPCSPFQLTNTQRQGERRRPLWLKNHDYVTLSCHWRSHKFIFMPAFDSAFPRPSSSFWARWWLCANAPARLLSIQRATWEIIYALCGLVITWKKHTLTNECVSLMRIGWAK